MAGKNVIVVGVDGSEAGRRALRWALREGALRGSTVEVVTAWTLPVYEGAIVAPLEAEQQAADIKAAQDQALGEELDMLDLPPPTVSQEVLIEEPVAALTRAARRAALLVVGSHGHGLLRSALLGSVSEGCIRHSACPVVVIPAPHPEEERLGSVAATESARPAPKSARRLLRDQQSRLPTGSQQRAATAARGTTTDDIAASLQPPISTAREGQHDADDRTGLRRGRPAFHDTAPNALCGPPRRRGDGSAGLAEHGQVVAVDAGREVQPCVWRRRGR
jgi:nucleotide-binding universal stress UspA family protein